VSICVSEALASGGLRTGAADRAVQRPPCLADAPLKVYIIRSEGVEKGTVEIRYEAEFSIFFVPRYEQVVLRNDFYVLDL